MSRQANSGVLYTYFLDWRNSLDPHTPRGEVTQYHLMENWKKSGYFPEHIQYRDSFLRQHPYFLVLHTDQTAIQSLTRGTPAPGARLPWLGNQLVKRFSADPEYQVKPYTVVTVGDVEESVYLVCRKTFHPCSAQAWGSGPQPLSAHASVIRKGQSPGQE